MHMINIGFVYTSLSADHRFTARLFHCAVYPETRYTASPQLRMQMEKLFF